MIDEKLLIERLLLESAGCKVCKLINPSIEDVKEFNAYKKCIEIVNQLAEESNNKSLYEITLNGCDDDTLFVMELTEPEYQFLLRVSEKSNETSTYGCMPRLYVEKCEQPLPEPFKPKGE